MAELRSPTLASLPTARAYEHAIARYKWKSVYRRTHVEQVGDVGMIAGQSTIFVIRFSAGARPPLLASPTVAATR
jgi:hypothetical protein